MTIRARNGETEDAAGRGVPQPPHDDAVSLKDLTELLSKIPPLREPLKELENQFEEARMEIVILNRRLAKQKEDFNNALMRLERELMLETRRTESFFDLCVPQLSFLQL